MVFVHVPRRMLGLAAPDGTSAHGTTCPTSSTNGSGDFAPYVAEVRTTHKRKRNLVKLLDGTAAT